MKLSRIFKEFFESEKSAGILLILCAIISLSTANSMWGESYQSLWQSQLFGKQLDYWINEALMAIFFLLIGLEIERELYVGELSNSKNATLPVMAAIGGMLFPASIHFLFNAGSAYRSGFGIPMATDIAFSLGVLSLLGKRVPLSLKIFLTALAIIDDLGAIITIALFYSKGFSFLYFGLALIVVAILILLNRLHVKQLGLYLLLGAVLWYALYNTGIHATISGVILAFTIPFRKIAEESPSEKLQHYLHYPVAFAIIPLFALANTSFSIPSDWSTHLTNSNSLGILLGLMLGKPLGILFMSYFAVSTGMARLPENTKWIQILGVGILAGIGFTMSIFISLLAFPKDTMSISESKMAIFIASGTCAIIGFLILYFSLRNHPEEKENGL